MTQPTDHEIQLTVSLMADDRAAFNSLYDLYHQTVYANILQYVRRTEIAEDLLQEVFSALWHHRNRLQPEKGVGAWLFRVSHNKSLLCLREALSEKKFLTVIASLSAAETGSPEAGTDTEELDPSVKMDILQDAIRILPFTKKEVFRLCKLEGKSYKEAALQLNISQAVVKESLRSAVRMIRKHISAQHPALQLTVMTILLSRQLI